MKISPLADILCLSCTLGLVLASPGVGAQAAPKASVEMTASRLTIRTERLEATFEKGSLISARNRLTNEAFARTDSPAGTQLLYKHHPALGVEDAEDVRLTRLSLTSGRFDLAWPDGSKASTTVAVDADTAEVVVTQEGRSAQPNLKGIAWSADGFSADLDVIVPGRSGIRFRKPFVSHHESLDWPMGWEIQFVILESRRDAARSGLWIRSDDTDMRFKALAIDFSDESVDLAFESHNPAPWETQSDVQSVRWRIDAYRGDWTVPAMQYRRWAEKAYGLVPLQEQPGRAEDVRAVVITGGYPEMLHTLAKTVDPKSVLLYVPGWRKDGYDRNYPEYDTVVDWWPDYAEEATKLGYALMPHVNYFGCDPLNPLYERFEPYHLREPHSGGAQWWLWDRVDPIIKFAYINPAHKPFRDMLVPRLIGMSRKWGADAIHLDQTLVIYNDYNGLMDGANCAEGNVALHDELNAEMPELGLSGEGLNEVTFRREPYAQRHVWGLDHANNPVTWNEKWLAAAHPICSFVFTPYTRIYGYLGLSNPKNTDAWRAWRRAYEAWGVIPTLVFPTIQQMENPSPDLVQLLREMALWTEEKIEPDWEGDWSDDSRGQLRFRYRTASGESILCVGDETGGSRLIHLRADGTEDAIYQVRMGSTIQTVEAGTLPGALAAEGNVFYGLDPERRYLVDPDGKRPSGVSLGRLSPKAIVTSRHSGKQATFFTLARDTRGEAAHLAQRMPSGGTGIRVAGNDVPMDFGGSFEPRTESVDGAVHPCIFAHPPWNQGPGVPAADAESFGTYEVGVPDVASPHLAFGLALRPATNKTSTPDGVTFRIEANGAPLFQRHIRPDAEAMETHTVPLEKWRGKRLRFTFLTGPGPEGNPTFDWALWVDPRVVGAEQEQEEQVTLRTSELMKSLFNENGPVRFEADHNEVRARTTFPGIIGLTFTDPVKAAFPMDLTQFTGDTVVVSDPPQAVYPPYVSARVATVECGGIERQGLQTHPPAAGYTCLDYLIRLPKTSQPALRFSYGVGDNSKTTGVAFFVMVDGADVFREALDKPDGWHEATVDLSAFAGRSILLSIGADALGESSFDWARWAAPQIIDARGK